MKMEDWRRTKLDAAEDGRAKARSGRQHNWRSSSSSRGKSSVRDQHRALPTSSKPQQWKEGLDQSLFFPYMRQIALQSTRIPLILRAVSMLHCLRSAVELENFLGHQSAACHWSSEPGSVGGSGPLEASRPLPGNELSSRRRSPWQPISKGPEDPAS